MPFSKNIIYLWFALSIVFPVHALGIGENNLCQSEVNQLACLKANFDALYEENFDRFWAIVHEAAAKAEKCSLLPDTVDFLDLVKIKSNNTEFNEFFSEIIERMTTRETECLLNAVTMMDEASQKLIMGKLRNPLFGESATIEKALKNAQNDKFKSIVDLYFKSNK